MRFGPVPLEQALGKILGHNITGEDGRRLLRKGIPLTAENIEQLRGLGRDMVYVAELESNDVGENAAALRIASCIVGDNIDLSGSATGRVNFRAKSLGLLRVDVDRLSQLNYCDGVSLATLPTQSIVTPKKMVATIKIIPYALPKMTVTQAEEIGRAGGPLFSVDLIMPHKVALILSGSPQAEDRIVSSFNKALSLRLENLGSSIESIDFISLENENDELSLAQTIENQIDNGRTMVILAGETAIMDRHDIAPRAVERAGGEVTCFGAPVDPGNLLMLGYKGSIPILGAPGCARSPKTNIVDMVLPRLLAGDRLTKQDVIAMGHGGLMEDVPERPLPRSQVT